MGIGLIASSACDEATQRQHAPDSVLLAPGLPGQVARNDKAKGFFEVIKAGPCPTARVLGSGEARTYEIFDYRSPEREGRSDDWPNGLSSCAVAL